MRNDMTPLRSAAVELLPPRSKFDVALQDTFTGVVNIYVNPLPGVAPLQMRVPAGTWLADLVPASRFPFMCIANGMPLRREYWLTRPVYAGDVISLHAVVQGGGDNNGSRGILQIVAAVVIAIASVYIPGFAAYAPYVYTAVSLLINVLVPAERPKPQNQLQDTSSTYDVNLAGNRARLGSPIPVIYGRMMLFPDFAANPYFEYQRNEQSPNGDQFYYALFAIGHGDYNIERVMIEDTSIDYFFDVQYNVLLPGVLPTLVNPVVVTAPEVAGQECRAAQYVGAFNACAPKQRIRQLAVDMVCPGLGRGATGGAVSAMVIRFRIETRPVDDFGVALAPWSVLAIEEIAGATMEQVRQSYTYDIATPARLQVRVVRLTFFDNNALVANTLNWASMRSYLDSEATLAPTVTHLEVRIRASEQLSGLSQRRIAVIARRRLRYWAPGFGWSTDTVETRSIAWALADKWTNPVYGDGLPDTRIDLQALYELDQVWANRQDRLDIIFDNRTDSLTADQTIAQCGRATVFRRNGVRTLSRDQQQDMPVAAFTTRNMLPGTASVRYAQVTEETPDGVVVEYFDNRAWDWLDVMCPSPGVTTPAKPVRLRLVGITGRTHATREGLYQAASNTYRRKFPSWQSEMEGIFVTFGSPVLFAPVMQSAVQSGDVAFWDEATLTAGMTEPLNWVQGANHFVRFMQDDGSVTDPLPVLPGPNPQDVTFMSLDSSIDIRVDDAARERTKYVFGTLDAVQQIVRVVAVQPQGRNEDGAPTYILNGVVEDDRVHSVDAYLLPGPGDDQDPVNPGPDDFPDTGILVPTLGYLEIEAYGPFGTPATVELVFRPDGSLTGYGTTFDPVQPPDMWIFPRPIELASAALYELRATLLAANTPNGATTPPYDTWLSLDLEWSWSTGTVNDVGQDVAGLFIRFEIREKATGVIQTTAEMRLNATTALIGGDE
jgi:sulfur carrier protein ThiS